MQIYSPAEDSYLLSSVLKKNVPKILNKNPNLKSLEIGSGSGFQLLTLKELGVKNIFSCDINPKAVSHCKKIGFNCIKSDLFSMIKGEYDLIIFNPPYLPEHRYDKFSDTSGGKKGDETILKFLKFLKNHLNPKGKCFLLISSLTPMTRINKILKSYDSKIIAKKKLFQEELYIFEILYR